jgi:hypothetical protein
MNSDAESPDAPGTSPTPEAGRARGRLEALRQRSSAVQDHVARCREELKRSRHLGLGVLAGLAGSRSPSCCGWPPHLLLVAVHSVGVMPRGASH